jgi:thymidylate synthase (FAD)
MVWKERMKMSKVTLISYTQMNPEIIEHRGIISAKDVEQNIATATNLSYSKKDISEILDRFEDEENIAGLFERSIGRGHHSVAEHSSFSFLIEDISLPCGEQILRHRTGKFTKQSYRYQTATLDAVVPPKIKRITDALDIYLKSVQQSYSAYKELVDEGIPKEDARFVIPTGTKCRMMMTIDARNLIHFLNHRVCNDAQWEVRGVAVKMYNHLKEVAPNLARYVTPVCENCTCALKHWNKKGE